MPVSYFKDRFGRRFTAGKGLPQISTELDSVRSFQFEVHFFGVPDIGEQRDLTIAAKQVSPIGYTVEDIEVHRVNDKVFYPGKPTPEEITIVFDDLYLRETASTLWRWFKSTTYNPLTGELTPKSVPGAAGNRLFKANKMEVVKLNNTLTPHSVIEVYGVYPKSFKNAELNYETNQFNTIEVTFRYDFMDHFNYQSINA